MLFRIIAASVLCLCLLTVPAMQAFGQAVSAEPDVSWGWSCSFSSAAADPGSRTKCYAAPGTCAGRSCSPQAVPPRGSVVVPWATAGLLLGPGRGLHPYFCSYPLHTTPAAGPCSSAAGRIPLLDGQKHLPMHLPLLTAAPEHRTPVALAMARDT